MRALLSGYYGKGNGGDEALLATLLQMLPPHVIPVVLSGDPQQTSDRYGVEAHDRMAILPVLRALRSCDALVWGGGSLIQDATSAASPLYYSGMMGLAQTMGLRTIAWAQGIGPLKRRITQALAQRTFGGCTKVSVRDRASAAMLADWRIPCVLAPDPVWALEAKPVPELWNLPAPRVTVTLRSHPQLTEASLANLTRALVDFQKATQSFIILLPFQQRQDLHIAQIIQSKLKDDISQIMCLEEPQLLKGVFRGVEMAIGMRLHSLIMAAAEGCRCFAVSYDPKINRLMEDLNMPGWDLSALPDDPNLISKTWIEHYANGDRLSRETIQSLIDRALMHRDVLREALSEPSGK
ncbi:polysaccharide pyruvyl transferase CsaB [Aetokthonos hydrillicola Thurmond2011]|uniref:Polysaccharide pyruvyl transferase CsaB n=1 Tax=Aetokthonos hydrillicola Thurmond2011 TaxID=2712845 RepID=A0AAP5I984_9CYAN|nr:polysaccharide pyruvyl transferase CsaB [Aetokthonos hydrillicola]MBO3463253.1 polysaccharide pyruvyl transferase CsaB [Aetokthonos hydrillicola CCALA 1050]MBW4583777.1 polysaccharide pyruvyl transferase CsaB [Aetokthonos hydrillicola CCALA 1050]MDR9895528.1 polysaccharide pyruvyl transferase CsaB [Aetokthonos hydrillicola Thurmond2011]